MSYRFPAEWEPHEFVWIGFPSDAKLWGADLLPAQKEVAAFARAVHAEGRGETVYLVASTEEATHVANELTGDSAHIIIEPFGDVWLRDTGVIIVKDGGDRVALDYAHNGWGGKFLLQDDNTIGQRLAVHKGIQVYSREMIFEGGAIDVDGQGLAVTTRQCVLNPNRNPQLSQKEIEEQLQHDLGLTKILWLDEGLKNDHTDGHVDNLARFVAPNRLVISEAGDDDPNHVAFTDARLKAEQLGVEVVPIPSVGTHYIANDIAPASYLNFYIGNVTVVVPAYGAENDDAAVAAIAELFPNKTTVGLPANHLLTGGGSFHCISQQGPRL
ncbi:agmatine deiminase family protein [Calycomorphotria hydatis]|uniref:Agmatine deiminase n=1 Tax=Calycomorphotria hydatis TaxID=2528027 RepID=A0A517TF77_9PLAN|nr:agmatine deiminase family protein [Calycomorphotria hydatis]QDT67031.1 Agmatine deiminase [Calycomorphotria hydatis]